MKFIETLKNVWKIEEKLRPLNMRLEELIAKKEIGELSEEEYNSESVGLKEEKELLEILKYGACCSLWGFFFLWSRSF